MAQHPSTPAGPRARPGFAPAAQPAVAPARHPDLLGALILFLLSRLLAPLLGTPGSPAQPARLACLLAVWALLPTRRLTRRTTDHPESAQAQAAATLRAIRRLVARAGWFIHGTRNRGMRPAPPPPAPHPPLRPARAPPPAPHHPHRGLPAASIRTPARGRVRVP
jgi:hypothetical protein